MCRSGGAYVFASMYRVGLHVHVGYCICTCARVRHGVHVNVLFVTCLRTSMSVSRARFPRANDAGVFVIAEHFKVAVTAKERPELLHDVISVGVVGADRVGVFSYEVVDVVVVIVFPRVGA